MSTSRPQGSSTSEHRAKPKSNTSPHRVGDSAPDYDAVDATDEAEKAADIKQSARKGEAGRR